MAIDSANAICGIDSRNRYDTTMDITGNWREDPAYLAHIRFLDRALCNNHAHNNYQHSLPVLKTIANKNSSF